MQSSNENATPQAISKEEMQDIQEQNAQMKSSLDSRQLPAAGNPEATVADASAPRVLPRYDIIQNQSTLRLIIPDLKTGPEDMGLAMDPGQFIKLTDFYTPQEINRSKGLRRASTEMKSGIGDRCVLVPLKTEEEASSFVVPKKATYPKGTVIEDPNTNDFDLRYEELEIREAKANEKLLKKTLAGRVTRMHGAAPAQV